MRRPAGNLFAGLTAQGQRVAVLSAELRERWRTVDHEQLALDQQRHGVAAVRVSIHGIQRIDPREMLK